MKAKRLLNLLLCTVLVLALLPAAPARAANGIWGGGATKPPGVGTSLSPYQISTGEHLKWFADQVNSGNTGIFAVLAASIVLNDTGNWQNWPTSPPANVWTPIGSGTYKFKGLFDGKEYTISGVYINGAGSNQGLFGCIGADGTGTVKNVKVASSYIKGQSYVGGICGYMNFFSEISGCESGATVIGSTDYSGGIIGSVAKNASLSNCRNKGSVTGGNLAGGIAGANNGTIKGCVNQGAIIGVGQSSWIGGLVGMNYSVLSNSYSYGSVSAGGNYVGGVLGTNGANGAVTNVYNAGTVTGGWPVCGNTMAESSLTNVYFLGASTNNGIGNHVGTGTPVNKSDAQFASGEVAYLMGAEYGQTLESGGDPLPVFRASDNSNAVYRLTYMNGEAVHATQYYNAGAAVSSNSITPPSMDNAAFSHWEGLPDSMPAQDVTVTANSTPIPPTITTTSPLPSGAAQKAYSVQIKATGTKPITFAILSGALPAGLTLNESTGEITGTPTEAGSSTVTIRAQNDQGYDDEQFTIAVSDEMPGSGTLSDPYKISKASHLIKFAEKVNEATSERFYAVLMADIELNDTSDWEDWDTDAPANIWTPIGINSKHVFKGGFDGNNHTVSGVYINSTEDYKGLFGYISFVTTVKNLNLAKSYIKGKDNVGGICGTLMNLCKLDNCQNAATIHGERNVGGVCGSVSVTNASIPNCENDGGVWGSECVGGIAGTNAGTIGGCRNSGMVRGRQGGRNVGGICGDNTSIVSNAYNTGFVAGDNGTGGICGAMNGMTTKTATLTGVYNNGAVAGPSNSAAICGVTNAYCALSNCYYLNSSSDKGIGYNAEDAYATVSKSAEQAASGEVAYLLGTAFGQMLGSDTYPVFRSSDGENAVYQLVYMNETEPHAAQYYNAGAAISAADVAVPKKSGHCFSHWEALPVSMPAGDTTTTAEFVPIKTPSAPQGLTATSGDAQIALIWTTPADNGGAAITKYEVSKDDGANWTDADSDTGHTFTGLINGQSYVFGVRAVNDAGSGTEATTSATPQAPPTVTVTSVTVKTAPIKTTYTAGEALDLYGLVVTLHKSDSSTEDVAFADFETSGITTSPACGSTLSTSNTSVTITCTADSQSVSQGITVNPAPVVNASISPDTGSFDKYAPADVTTTVTWGNATGIADVKATGTSIDMENYSVSGDTLTIKKEYLAAQATGGLVLTVEFNAGAAAALAVTISDTTPPAISPVSHNYDLSSPADVGVTISWNSASSVTDVVYSVSPDKTQYTLDTGDYTVAGDDLTIKNSLFSGLSLTTGDALDFVITFNTGATADLAVNVVDSYVPGSNADLSSLSVNGTPVSGFDPGVIEYDAELPYGSSVATVTAAASDANAQVSITQAAPLPGTATVTITAEDGKTTKVYKIHIIIGTAPTYTVTFSSNGSSYATKAVKAGASIGNAAWPADPARNSYTFGGWFTGENGAGVQFASATPVNATMTVYAKWTYSGGNGGGSDDSALSTRATPTYNADFKAGSGAPATLPVTVDKNSGIARIDIGSHKLTSGGTVITIPPIPDIDTYSVGIPVSDLAAAGKEGTLTVETGIGSITVASNMLTGVSEISVSKAEISIGQGDKDNLPDDVKSAIGDKPLIQLTLSIDGQQTDWNNSDAPVTVSIPYTPTAEELANPENIVIWYIDGSGNVVTVPNGRYDPVTGTVTFTTTHFSAYAVAYNDVSFNDVATGAWYNKAVGFIAARGITYGTGNGNFSPEAKLTRGQFVVMLLKAYGIAPAANSTGNFTDAGNTWYTGYLAAAKHLRISAGVGNNLFAPEKDITRQEMFTLLYNALKVIDRLPQGNSGKTISDFTDAGQIDAWTKEAMTLLVKTGIVGGYNGKLTPQGATTRAEMAQALYSLLGK